MTDRASRDSEIPSDSPFPSPAQTRKNALKMELMFALPRGTLIPFPNHSPGPVTPPPLPRPAVPAARPIRFSLGGMVVATGAGMLLELLLVAVTRAV